MDERLKGYSPQIRRWAVDIMVSSFLFWEKKVIVVVLLPFANKSGEQCELWWLASYFFRARCNYGGSYLFYNENVEKGVILKRNHFDIRWSTKIQIWIWVEAQRWCWNKVAPLPKIWTILKYGSDFFPK